MRELSNEGGNALPTRPVVIVLIAGALLAAGLLLAGMDRRLDRPRPAANHTAPAAAHAQAR